MGIRTIDSVPSARKARVLKIERTVLNPVKFRAFETSARAQGFGEVVERDWKPLTVLAIHAHPFALKALVVRGEMWLTVADHTRYLKPGDAFELDRDVPHAERYGSDGATYWVARRGGSAASRE